VSKETRSASLIRFCTTYTQFSLQYIAYQRHKYRPFGAITNIKTYKMAAPVRQASLTPRKASSCFQ